MINRSYFVILKIAFVLFSLVSCNGKKEIEHKLTLDPSYQEIKTIHSVADCTTPDGKNYTTEVISENDGSCLFIQEYKDDNVSFRAQITKENMGFVLDEQDQIVDTLSVVDIEIIRSHEFHKMHTNPSHFFSDIHFDNEIDSEHDLYIAKDRLNNPARLLYNKNSKLIDEIVMLNPRDTTQQIEIINKKFDVFGKDYGMLVKELSIVQGHKDTFQFAYKIVKIKE